MAFSISLRSSTSSIGCFWRSVQWVAGFGASTLWKIFEKSSPLAFQCASMSSFSSSSEAPMISSSRATPSDARIWRTSSATKKK
ncbi:hypothetical protein D9M72_600080 [compost metagenome]